MPSTQGLPEFSLAGKVVLVSGAARGLGLVQAEALLEAGAKGMHPSVFSTPNPSSLHASTVYALDRLPEPSPDFAPIAEKAKKELGTLLEYRQIDVRDVAKLHQIVEEIANKEGRLDGLIAAAGIQQETTALEYTAEDANRMFEINITGVMMTAQAAAKQMIKFGKGGSIVMIASMSGHIANRVRLSHALTSPPYTDVLVGPHLLGIQRVESRRYATRTEPGIRMGRAQHPRQHHL
jgi:NAD(P)-dependent dehydrogenase (short-subunit alcohol dehydrogenase family)